MKDHLHVIFEGATWSINQNTIDKLNKYTVLLDDVPQLANYIEGFLFHDTKQTIYTYLITALFFYAPAQLHPAMAFAIYLFLIHIIYYFLEQVEISHTVTKDTPNFKNAFILFLSFHRIKIYMHWKKWFLLIFIIVFLYLACPAIVFAFLLPIFISSILIYTETIVNSCRIY